LPVLKEPVVEKAMLTLFPAHTVGTGGMLVMSIVGGGVPTFTVTRQVPVQPLPGCVRVKTAV